MELIPEAALELRENTATEILASGTEHKPSLGVGGQARLVLEEDYERVSVQEIWKIWGGQKKEKSLCSRISAPPNDLCEPFGASLPSCGSRPKPKTCP